ncbi:hypothetical protein SAMN04487936_101605 [Halobacillus dabanensis]|uniref:YesK-like protein n=1 Tax=Halobacillus dabanensis TaxID=240302 RepID=A0A1I3Q8M4_HALDA|nr:hypothetical protein [Halobacillus dabanensis]SFJ30453.1 hypothetical protein SAMN04487936_101605 [Halobacillus dabanensis]
MTMLVFSGLSILILLGALLSYFTAKQGLRKNKKVLENVFLATCVIIFFGLVSALLWFKYAGPISEFLLFGGIIFIIGITLTFIVILAVTLLVRKRKFIQSTGAYMES